MKVAIENLDNGAVLYSIEQLGIYRCWAKNRHAVGQFVKRYVRRKTTYQRLMRGKTNVKA